MGNSVATWKIAVTVSEKPGSLSKYSGFIVVHGDKGKSDVTEIDSESNIKAVFERTLVYDLKTSNKIGEPWMLEIWAKNKSKDQEWFITKIDIWHTTRRDKVLEKSEDMDYDSMDNKRWQFLVYRWIGDKVFVWQPKATLAHLDTKERQSARKYELERKRAAYQLEELEGLPAKMLPAYDQLPADEKFNDSKMHDFEESVKDTKKNFFIEKLLNITNKPFRDLDKYIELFKTLKIPSLCTDWQTDEKFAMTKLHGASCTLIERIQKLPENLVITQEDSKHFVGFENDDFAKALEAGRFYLLDFSVAAGLKTAEGRYMCCPFAVFFMTADKKKFLPACIQLYSNRKTDPDTNPLFFPDDPKYDWLLAKVAVNSVELTTHQMASHVIRTHLWPEAVFVCMHRQLPTVHPIYKLLLPHTEFQLAINGLARQTLLAKDGILARNFPLTYSDLFEVAKREYKKWTFMDAALPAMLKIRNIPGPEELPKYYYRDDAGAIWDAIQAFCTDVVNVYYKSDEDVTKDVELQNWAKEVDTVALKDKDFPCPITDKAALAHILTIIIFTVSAQHAAVNFSQYETFAYIPASPGALYKEPPAWNGAKYVKGTVDEKFILKSMPPKHLAVEQVAVLHVLSSYSREDSMLGHYPECLFTETATLEAIKKFDLSLRALNKKITDRNDWNHLAPLRIPNSTAI